MLINQQQNIDEVDTTSEWMKSNGWEKNAQARHWAIDVADALSVPTAPFYFV